MSRSNGIVVGFWILTALFCLPMGFTARAQLRLRAGGGGVHPPRLPRLLSRGALVGRFLGVVLLLAPVPARLKE